MNDYNKFCQKDITLRDYQQLAKEQIFSQWNYVNSILYQMPTGTGKTRLFTSVIRDIRVWGLRHNINYRILIIAHRSELIQQSSKSLDKYHIKHGVLAGTMKEKRDLLQPIQVASIQTITHPSNRCLIEDLNFDFIIIDEAHHAVANSYQLLWDFCPDSKKLGVTATPWRMNNFGFAKIFDVFLPSMSIQDFIKKGWLASYAYYSIPINSEIIKSIDSIHEFDIEGDYKTSSLINAIDTNKIRAQLYKSYSTYALGKKGIIYSISREHSEHICAQYRCHGVPIEKIDSRTPIKVRENIIKLFKEGSIDIIVNVDIFSEGFDCPDIEFIQLARPTMSLVKYIQQVGRGLRRNGEKQCIILDNVGMYSRFGLPDENRDWSVFFYGHEIDNASSKSYINRSFISNCEQIIDISEGNEDMILIQEPETVLYQKRTQENKKNVEPILNKAKDVRHFSIESRSFSSGKYVVEENENGFFIVNKKTQNKMHLLSIKTMIGGVIIIKKERGKNNFTIIKAMTKDSAFSTSSRIIGSLVKEGLILRFHAFDNTDIIKTISV